MGLLDGVRWIELPSVADSRGVLTAIESGQDIPFEIKRVFYMHHIQAERGGHAHTETDQVIIAVAGRLKMELLDGESALSFELKDPTKGLYVPRMIFIRHYDYSPGAVCLVLASSHYDMAKSLRSWEDYLAARAKR